MGNVVIQFSAKVQNIIIKSIIKCHKYEMNIYELKIQFKSHISYFKIISISMKSISFPQTFEIKNSVFFKTMKM